MNFLKLVSYFIVETNMLIDILIFGLLSWRDLGA
jgi:hypothetical protein